MARRLVSKFNKTAPSTVSGPLSRLRQMRPAAVHMPVSFAQALTAYSAEQRRDNRSRRHRVNRAWAEALEAVLGEAGRDYGRRCEVRSVAQGVIRVAADSAALAHLLGVVNRRSLLDQLRLLLKGKESVVDLTVRVVSNGALPPARQGRFVPAKNESVDDLPDDES